MCRSVATRALKAPPAGVLRTALTALACSSSEECFGTPERMDKHVIGAGSTPSKVPPCGRRGVDKIRSFRNAVIERRICLLYTSPSPRD